MTHHNQTKELTTWFLTYVQFCELQILIKGMQGANGLDQWKNMWGSGQDVAAKAYKIIIGSQSIHPTFIWIWQSSCQQKHKILYWLLLKNRLNTRGMLRMRNMHLDSYDCELCLL
jgi:hypothetical protein